MATLDSQLRAFFEWLWAASWQVSVLILAILFTQWALRKYLSPRTRYALWLLVLVRLALPTLPESPFSLFNLIPQPEAVVASVSRSWNEGPPFGLNATESESFRAAREAPLPPSDQPSSAKPEPQGSSTPTSIAEASTAGAAPSDWPKAVPILWAAGAFLFAAFLIGQSVATRSWYKRLATKADPELEGLLEECKRQVGVKGQVRLAQAPEMTSPALMGYWRPTLLIPEGIVSTIGLENLRYVFTHELAHLKRRDILANWIATFFGLLHWFNPVVWYAFRRMRTDQELACDHQALSYIGQEEKKRYSATILALFERVVLPQRLPGMAGILEDKSLMKRRIQMIVEGDLHEDTFDVAAIFGIEQAEGQILG